MNAIVLRTDELPEDARRALARARAKRFSYSVSGLRAPDGRVVVILGEAHMKLEEASRIGRDVVGSFELRGVETFQQRKVVSGRALGFFIQAPRTLLRVLSLGAIKGSTITDAKQLPSGYTVELERAKRVPLGLHVSSVYMTAFFAALFAAMLAPLIASFAPVLAGVLVFVAMLFQVHAFMVVPAFLLRRYSWCWVVHPFLGILTLRDELMVEGTVRMLEDYPRAGPAVVVMGRAHVRGFTRLLVERHGFRGVELVGPG